MSNVTLGLSLDNSLSNMTLRAQRAPGSATDPFTSFASLFESNQAIDRKKVSAPEPGKQSEARRADLRKEAGPNRETTQPVSRARPERAPERSGPEDAQRPDRAEPRMDRQEDSVRTERANGQENAAGEVEEHPDDVLAKGEQREQREQSETESGEPEEGQTLADAKAASDSVELAAENESAAVPMAGVSMAAVDALVASQSVPTEDASVVEGLNADRAMEVDSEQPSEKLDLSALEQSPTHVSQEEVSASVADDAAIDALAAVTEPQIAPVENNDEIGDAAPEVHSGESIAMNVTDIGSEEAQAVLPDDAEARTAPAEGSTTTAEQVVTPASVAAPTSTMAQSTQRAAEAVGVEIVRPGQEANRPVTPSANTLNTSAYQASTLVSGENAQGQNQGANQQFNGQTAGQQAQNLQKLVAKSDQGGVQPTKAGDSFESLLNNLETKGLKISPASVDQRGQLAGSKDFTALKPYTTSLPTPMNQDEWSDEFVEKVKWLTSKHIRAAEIHVRPAELGPIEIKIHVNQDQASIVFNSQHAQVRDLLELNVHRLRDMLDSSGVNLADVDVSDQSAQNSDASGAGDENADGKGEGGLQGQGDPDGGAVEEVTGIEARVASRSLVDTFA